jgi:uncharacterized protein (TIGR03000 family)
MARKHLGAWALTAIVVLALPATIQAQLFRGGWRGDRGWYGRGGYSYRSYGYNPYGSMYYNYGPGSYTYGMPDASGYQSTYPPADFGSDVPDVSSRVLAAVRLPSPDAQLSIEGKDMGSGSAWRRFFSPPLDQGQRYTYTFKATWTENGKPVERTRQVNVQPGARIMVDFTRPEPMMRGGARQSGYGVGPDETITPRRDDLPRPNQSKPKPNPDVPDKN